ncbi:MAG: hypothetical protein HY905_18785 [Deltaproteobacteria bacterium]|nr:hypothetical protein [Deltaproteobacteria bacterium]
MNAPSSRNPVLSRGLVRLGTALALAATLAACDDGGASAGPFDSAELNAGRTRIVDLAGSASVVFAGSVRSVGTAPASWSGFAAARQTVDYDVTAVLAGAHADPTIAVAHLVVEDSRQAASDTPGLDPTLFAIGSALIVFARQSVDGSGFEDASENFSAIPDTPRNREAVQSLLP